MRKQTKLVAVLSAAALLAIGATMTASAATASWTEQDGVWVYLDSDGERVTNEWKKSNNSFYYLDDNGEMTVDTWIDGEYYVGTDGKMISSNWAKLVPENGGDENPDGETERWYYFDNAGKKYSNGKKTVNGKSYFFDSDGNMEYGWYEGDDNNIYYLGDADDGARKSGWLWLEPDNGEDGVDADCDEVCDAEGWYWFETSGKLYKDSKVKTINGKKYYFNAHGQMLYNWLLTGTSSEANVKDDDSLSKDLDKIEDLKYTNDGGQRISGWLKVDGSYTAGTEGDNNWYSFKDGGVRKADGTEGGADEVVLPGADARYRKIISVDGKKFCFDQLGKMKTGLQGVAGGADYVTYYFDDNGNMKTGKVSGVSLDDGNTANFYFNTSGQNKGQGYTGEKDGYLYYKGMRLEADSDYKFYTIGSGAEAKTYLVNKSGKVQVYNKAALNSNGDRTNAAGKKIDTGKLDNGTDFDTDYAYIYTDAKGAIADVMKYSATDKENDKTDKYTIVGATDYSLGWE